VGKRLALAARAIAYGDAIEYSGPLFRQVTPEGASLRVWFDHAADGMMATSGALQGFEIAGEDHRFVPAVAQIDGQTVVLSSPAVKAPKYARYGWANAPLANLANKLGLPAGTFTSEDPNSEP